MSCTQGSGASAPCNPRVTTTAAELEALFAEHAAAEAALKSCLDGPAHQAAEARYLRAFAAVLAARPDDPASMGRLLRWILENDALAAECEPALQHIARRLEAMAT